MRPSGITEIEFSRPDDKTASCLSKACPVVIYSGDSIRPRWHIGERKTFNYLWVFIGSGEGVFKVRGNEFKVVENDFIWVPPDTLFEMSGTSDEMHCIWAHIDLIFNRERTHLFRVPAGIRDLSPWREFIQPPFGDDTIDSICGLIKLANPLHVKMLFKELCRTHRLASSMNFKLAGLILEIISEILSSNRPKTPLDEKMSRAVVLIREYYDRNLDVALLAKKIGLSDSYFRMIFRKTCGMGPVAFHRELRIREACSLMINEGLNVSETGNALGFSSASSFSRAFKDVMHISPKNFCKEKI